MENYRSFLIDGLERYFDIKEDYCLDNTAFELFAKFHQRNAKYMLMKNIEIYAFQSNEYLFHRKLDRVLKEEDLIWLKAFLDKNLEDIVEYDSDHMSSVVTVLFEGQMPESAVQRKLTKFKYYKSFSLGFKGWVNVKVLLIDPVGKNGMTNKLAKDDLLKFIRN